MPHLVLMGQIYIVLRLYVYNSHMYTKGADHFPNKDVTIPNVTSP